MTPSPLARILRRSCLVAALVLAQVACGGPIDSATHAPTTPSSPIASPDPATGPRWAPGLSGLPREARLGDGGPAPRPADYWAAWNACAPENRAAEAAANGGAAAGFVLIDDLLVQPGLGLGNHRLATCEEALVVLQAADSTDRASMGRLAAQVLLAELNLNVGSETCPAAEEALIGGQLILERSGYDGPGVPVRAPVGDAERATPTLIDMLSYYNSGVLCD